MALYNHYLPQGDREPAKSGGLGGLLGQLGLSGLDAGDILLMLVLLFLYQEKKDEDWLIVLALVFFLR